MAPSGLNDASREVMAALKKWFTRTHGLTDAGVLVAGVLGSTVTVSVSYDVAPASLFTGFEFSFKAGAACPAGALIAINGLGNKNFQKLTPAGYINVVANDYLANQHVKGKYDATLDKCILLSPIPTAAVQAASDTEAGPIELAIQSEMETGTDVLRAVTPGRQHFHDSAAKGWTSFNSAGTQGDSYNVTSVTDTGTGDFRPLWGNDFSSAAYSVVSDVERSVATYHNCDTKTAAGITVLVFNAAAAAVDPTTTNVTGHGDL